MCVCVCWCVCVCVRTVNFSGRTLLSGVSSFSQSVSQLVWLARQSVCRHTKRVFCMRVCSAFAIVISSIGESVIYVCCSFSTWTGIVPAIVVGPQPVTRQTDWSALS